MKFNLSEYEGRILKVLSGSTLGEEVRNKFNLDYYDKQGDEVIFVIPNYVYSLNSSFFSGLFQKSIKSLGEDRFREIYKFECSDIIRENIEDGIFNILNTLNLLG